MRLVAIGGLVTLLSVLGLRTAFEHGPDREFCNSLSVSPDDRFQLEAWRPVSFSPLTRAFAGRSCDGGWFVIRETATGRQVAELEWADFAALHYSDDVRWEPRAVTVHNPYFLRHGSSEVPRLELPPELAPISTPPDGWKCSDISASPDGKHRLEAWSHRRPAGCLGGRPGNDETAGEVWLIEQPSERVISKARTDYLVGSFGMVHWGADRVEFDLSNNDKSTRESVSFH